MVAPGFIDLHVHSDQALLDDGNGESAVRQGVTLDVLGEGGSVAPRDGLPQATQPGGWTNFTGYFNALKQKGHSLNVISHVSYHQIRRVVMGYDLKPASPAQLDRMKQLMARSMEEGAWGLVTRFDSGGPAQPNEVIELAKVAAAYGGNYTTHIGSEGFEQDKELDFLFRVAQEARIPVHMFHLKIRARENWGTIGKYLAKIEAARARGLDVTANQYPYTAMNHGWNDFFPLWVEEGGPEEFAKRLKDPAVRERIKKDPDFLTWSKEHGGPEGIVLGLPDSPRTRNTRACASPRSRRRAKIPMRPTRSSR